MPSRLWLESEAMSMSTVEFSKDHHSSSPKSVSLLDEDEEFRVEETMSGSIEVEITPNLAAKFDDYNHHSLEGEEVDAHAPDNRAPRRRSLPQTSFPSQMLFPSRDSPDTMRALRPKISANWSQWIIESFQEMDVGAEQMRMNAAASVGIQSILSGMRRHRDNSRVQRYGCGALRKLASQSNNNRTLIVQAGGVLDIVTAMECHPRIARIQECGCSTLSSLSKVANWSACFAQCNGIETILQAMRGHGSNEAVQKHACLALLGLACSSANHNAAIARLGGIEDIMAAVSRHAGNTDIREYGRAALWSMAYMCPNNGTAIEKAGGLQAIFDDAINRTDKEQLLTCLSQEDQCLHVINKQRKGDSEDQDAAQIGPHGVDAILSVFVRPLQQ